MQRFIFKERQNVKMAQILKSFFLLFVIFLSLYFNAFCGGSSSKSTAFLRDQFATEDNYIVNGINISDAKLHYNLGYCGDKGVNFCGSQDKTANCCLGDENFGYSTWVKYEGKDYSGHKLMICFAYPDGNKISYKCEAVHPKDGEKSINLNVGRTVLINAKLHYYDEENPGFDVNFNTSGVDCGCKDIAPNVIHCAGYALLPYIIKDQCVIADKINSKCQDKKKCPCDASCALNDYLPFDLKKMDSKIQECYLCNRIGYVAEKNCKSAKICYDSDLLNKSREIFNNGGSVYYGSGAYLCGYIDGQRAGCAKITAKDGPRHFNRIAYISDSNGCKDKDLKKYPQCNLFQDFPYVREFRDIDEKSTDLICNQNKSAELGYENRGTFFNPKLIVKLGEMETTATFTSKGFNRINISRIYNETTLDNKNFDKNITDILKVTPFGDTVYRIKKGFHLKNPDGSCSLIFNNLDKNYYDVIVRLEYSLKTNESEFVAYLIKESASSSNRIISYDKFSGKINTYIDDLSSNDFISNNVNLYDDITKQTTSYNLGKKFILQRIGNISRPVIRHYYINNVLKHPISIVPNPNEPSSTNTYFNSFFIHINPANSVSPTINIKDEDYTMPQNTEKVYISKNTATGIVNNITQNKSNCVFMYGHRFCIGVDSCSILSFIDTYTYLLNPPVSISVCNAATNNNAKIDCMLAFYLVPACNDRVFCLKNESKDECQERVQIKLYKNSTDYYKINKNYQDELFTCLTDYSMPDHISARSNVKRFGPYGNASLDTVVTFKRETTNVGFSTRPITTENPYKREKFSNIDIYNAPLDYFNTYKDQTLINMIMYNIQDRLSWIADYIKCKGFEDANSCFLTKLQLRPIEAEEWPKNTLCSSLIYNKNTVANFDKSRLQQIHDYDFYIPLRCQKLKIEMYGAGGGGTSERSGQYCRVFGGILGKSDYPRIPATGCSGAYINAYFNQNINSYNSDYLSLQVGERTQYCKIDKQSIDQYKDWEGASWYQTKTYFGCDLTDQVGGPWLQGGCHKDEWRGNSVLSLFNSYSKSIDTIAKAGKGKSQIDFIQSHKNYAGINKIDISNSDAACATAYAFLALGYQILCTLVFMPICPPAAAAIVEGILACSTYSIADSYLNPECPGVPDVNNRYLTNIVNYVGNQAKLSSGEVRDGDLAAFKYLKFDSRVYGADGIANQADNLYQSLSSLTKTGEDSYLHNKEETKGVFNIDNQYIGSGGAFNNGNTKASFQSSSYKSDSTKIGMQKIFEVGPLPCEIDSTTNLCKKDATGKDIPIAFCTGETDCTAKCPTNKIYSPSSIKGKIGGTDCINLKSCFRCTYMNLKTNNQNEMETLINNTNNDLKTLFSPNVVNVDTKDKMISDPNYVDDRSGDTENSFFSKKYSGGGGSGRINISIPIVKHININKKDMHPYFDSSGNKIPCGDNDCYTDMDCKFKCPRMNVLFKDSVIELRDRTVIGDLICEYSGYEDNDGEIVSQLNVIYPKKCYIDSENSNNNILKSFHGYVVSSGQDCPVSKCINGIININSRLYGMCSYGAGLTLDGQYKKAIQSNGNIFSGYVSSVFDFYATSYSNQTQQLSTCININSGLGIIFSSDTLADNRMGLMCINGFWQDPSLTQEVNQNLNNYQMSIIDEFGNQKDNTWALTQINQARMTDVNDIEPSSYFKEISVTSRRVFKNRIKCPPLIEKIDYDIEYTGNAAWSSTNAGSTSSGKCKTGFKINGTSTPTRICNINGIWGQIINPCVKK